MTDTFLQMKNISKKFPGVIALDDVSLSVEKGEIHGLVGENGAGKSTIMKILCGFYPKNTYQGEIFINNRSIDFYNIEDSRKSGIAMIYQELVLVKELSAAENIFLGEEPRKGIIINWDKLHKDASKWLSKVGLNIHPSTKVKDLSVSQQQLLEIAKALSKNADILILDEPTASLTESETDHLMKILRSLKKSEVTSIFISHKIKEVMKICDTITILRDGKVTDSRPKSELSEKKIISNMVGRELTNLYPIKNNRIGKPIIKLNNFNLYPLTGNLVIKNINFTVNKGEVLGLAGLMGAGRTELLTGIFGSYKGKTEGEILLYDRKIEVKQPLDAIKNGIFLIPEDRRTQGLILLHSVLKNISLANLQNISKLGVIDLNKEHLLSHRIKDSLNIKTKSLNTIVGNLSGGNQQKVVLAKWLVKHNPIILLLDEPTRGIDVGAKFEIYNIIKDLSENGISIVMASSELPELLGICDRILVMNEGKITGEFLKEEASEQKIMLAATGKNEV